MLLDAGCLRLLVNAAVGSCGTAGSKLLARAAGARWSQDACADGRCLRDGREMLVLTRDACTAEEGWYCEGYAALVRAGCLAAGLMGDVC